MAISPTGNPGEAAVRQGAEASADVPKARGPDDSVPAGGANDAAEIHPKVKERIERCALDLFGRKGYAATSVREIVEAAGVTKPSLYYYFRDKEHLYESLVLGTLESFAAELSEVVKAPGTLAEKLRRIAAMHFEHVRSGPMLVRVMFRALFGFAAQTPQIDLVGFAERSDALMRGLLEEAAGRGEIPRRAASDLAVVQFHGIVNVYLMRNAAGMRDDLSPELAGRIVDLFLNGLRSSG